MVRGNTVISLFVWAWLQQGLVADAVQVADLFHSLFDVVSPPRLQMELDHRDALFGSNPFGHTIEKDLYYTSRSLCDDEWPGTPDSIEHEGYILMIDRGGCSFVTKVRNAQRANATAVIIADHTCLCSAEATCSSEHECQKYESIMDDDGTGDDIVVPSMLLAKQDADMLKQELIGGTMIHLRLSWPLPTTVNGQAHYSLWTSPEDVIGNNFLNSFKYAAVSLGAKARFRPSMFIANGDDNGCRDGSESCDGMCTNGNRYCVSPYDGSSTYESNLGAKIVLESLRRQCIWQEYGEADGIGVQWWDYILKWNEKCSNSKFSTTCAHTVFPEVGISEVSINSCIESSGGVTEDQPNTILDQLLTKSTQEDIPFAPTIFVNGANLRGKLSFGNVLDALCWSYGDQDVPGLCTNWHQCKSLCPEGKECILRDDQCEEYEAMTPPPYDGETYDDDIFGDSLVHPDAPLRTLPPIPPAVPITRAPTARPAPTEAPTVTPATPQPTAKPVSAPTPTSEKPQGAGPGEHYGGSSVNETIEIYGDGGSGKELEVAILVVIVMSAILGCCCFGAIAFCLFLRVIRPRRRRRRRGDKRALVDPVHELFESESEDSDSIVEEDLEERGTLS